MGVIPNPPEGSKAKKGKETRAQAWKRRTGKDHQRPDVGEFEHLVRHWGTLGRFVSTGMGRAWLPWSEIKAWMDATGTELAPYEVEWLHGMSRAYVSMLNEAEDPQCQPPYLMEMGKIDRAAISDGIKAAFMGFVKDAEGKDKGRKK